MTRRKGAETVVPKRLVAALTALLLSALLPVAAYAAAGDLCICLRGESDAPIPDIRVEVLQVAVGQGDSAAVTADFSAVCPNAEALTGTDSVLWAQTLYQYALERGLSGQIAVSDARGEAAFSGLADGVYLVLERGGQRITFLPYLVSVTDAGLTSAPKLEESGSKCLTVSKVWDDGNDVDGLRPAMVTVTLYRDGGALRKATLSTANGWRHTFSTLPDTGAYTVTEAAVDGYTADYAWTEDGVQITNRHRNSAPDAVSVEVRKLWEDADDAAGARPARITVQLVKDGVAVKTAVLSESNDWTVSFAGLRADCAYSVWELPVENYTAAYDGSVEEGFLITNRYTGDADVPPPSDQPQTPQPTIPQTGARMDVICALFALGISLTLLGVAVLRRGRGKT